MNKLEDKLKFIFGEEWYAVLKDYLHTDSFLKISRYITEERKNYTIYPESEKVFRIFKECKYEDIKVFMCFQDPYHDGSACGIATCNCESLKLSPTLRIMLQEIDRTYPESNENLLQGLDRMDLHRWIKQGIFLYNTALTVRKGQAGSHIDIWKEFTSEVIKTLNKKESLTWLLLGSYAQKYKNQINPNHNILETFHPAYEIYNPNTFIGSNIFVNCNKFLTDKIIW